MVNRQRAQGTEAEVRVERLHQDVGFVARLIRGRGRNDQGDVEIVHPKLGTFVASVKDGERLNTVAELERHAARSGQGAERSVLFTTQRYRVDGQTRRRTRRAVVISEGLWIELLQRAVR